jgi:hypothetical protein
MECQGDVRKVISASRRTDLVASFPDWLAGALKHGAARVVGPSGHTYTVSLNPKSVHTLVLWSKDFRNILFNKHGLREQLIRFRQLYLHFTITGLGGTFWERGVPDTRTALSQLEDLISLTGDPRRLSVRFDPVVFWEEERAEHTNLHLFETIAPDLAALDIRTVRFSFAQWYRKSRRRTQKFGISTIDPPVEKKLGCTEYLAGVAETFDLRLFSCSQSFLAAVPGVQPSACIDGVLLQELHPDKEPISHKKDRTQRVDCRCTESVDIGSYAQCCPRSCLYCYANPSV